MSQKFLNILFLLSILFIFEGFSMNLLKAKLQKKDVTLEDAKTELESLGTVSDSISKITKLATSKDSLAIIQDIFKNKVVKLLGNIGPAFAGAAAIIQLIGYEDPVLQKLNQISEQVKNVETQITFAVEIINSNTNYQIARQNLASYENKIKTTTFNLDSFRNAVLSRKSPQTILSLQNQFTNSAASLGDSLNDLIDSLNGERVFSNDLFVAHKESTGGDCNSFQILGNYIFSLLAEGVLTYNAYVYLQYSAWGYNIYSDKLNNLSDRFVRLGEECANNVENSIRKHLDNFVSFKYSGLISTSRTPREIAENIYYSIYGKWGDRGNYFVVAAEDSDLDDDLAKCNGKPEHQYCYLKDTHFFSVFFWKAGVINFQKSPNTAVYQVQKIVDTIYAGVFNYANCNDLFYYTNYQNQGWNNCVCLIRKYKNINYHMSGNCPQWGQQHIEKDRFDRKHYEFICLD